MHQSRDAVQSIEQEVRMQLHLESLQLRLYQLRLQLRRFGQPRLVALVVHECVLHAHHHRKEKGAGIEGHLHGAQQLCPGELIEGGGVFPHNQVVRQLDGGQQNDKQRRMDQQMAGPVRSFQAKSARAPKDGWCGDSPEIRVGHLGSQTLCPGPGRLRKGVPIVRLP
jgi:hypothetical protein